MYCKSQTQNIRHSVMLSIVFLDVIILTVIIIVMASFVLQGKEYVRRFNLFYRVNRASQCIIFLLIKE